MIARLPAGIGHARSQQDRGGRRGRGREAHAGRVDDHLAEGAVRARLERAGRHAAHLAPVVQHAHGLAPREHLRARAHRPREEHLHRVVLRVVGAADLAEAAADAAGAVVREATARPAERAAAGLEQEVVPVPALARHGADREQRLHLLVEQVPRLHRELAELALVRPARADRFRDALDEVQVVQRRAADAAPLVDLDRAIGGRAPPAVPVEAREHLLLALDHVGGREELPRLEHDDGEPRLGRLHRDHRAARAGAHDAEVRVHVEREREARGVVDHVAIPPPVSP